MTRTRLLVLWAALVLAAFTLPHVLPAPPAAADFPKASDNRLHYAIDARLDAQSHEITATGVLRWRNESPVEVTEIRLHLYLNAFKNERSTFMRESGGSHRGNTFFEDAPGWIRLTSFKRKGGPELLPADEKDLEFIHEDDGNTDDQTVLRVELDAPLAAQAEAEFEIAWTSRMPRVFARTGQAGNGAFFMVAQWFPKPGVWEQDPATSKWFWNCHQFHGSSEFYADYGSYDVHLTVPARFEERVGATGARVDLGDALTKHLGRRNADGTITYRHKVDHVHDFAWVCGEDFEVHTFTFAGGAGVDEVEQARVAGVLGVQPSTLDLPEVTVYVLLQPEHADQLDRHRRAVENALTYMGFWYGPYPYPTLTVVDPDHRGSDAGGMEYPTLITGGTGYVRAERQTSPEGVLVHEFGHQHFYGLLGSNEFRHAWMDEGMCTFATGKVLTKAYKGYSPAQWYAGWPHYGERPFRFGGLAAEARKSVPVVEPLFDESWRVPFGRLGVVRAVARAVGADSPPDAISVWGGYGEISPLAFLREVPTLTHLQPLPSTTKEWERASNAATPMTDPIAGRRAWEYMTRRSYGNNSYRRPASSLRTIEGYLGEETMLRAMRAYCAKWRFKHPAPADFYAALDEVAVAEGKGSIRWLLDELFETATTFDFGIESVEVDSLPGPETKGVKDAEKADEVFESNVIVRRYGGVRMPIDVRLRFEDGTVRDFLWLRNDELREYAMRLDDATGRWERGALGDADVPAHAESLARVTPARGEQQRWARLRIRGSGKVLSAEVDPYYAYSLDGDRTNDGRSTRTNRAAALQIGIRALGWVELSHAFYGGL
ncbi:MAG: M1 family metallopeptidase [Planctomycetota bacterium]|nr:M1 family metallopeptidase [Planctomycetota bacterium]